MTGQEIADMRQRLGLSQEALAREIGCSVGALRRWEQHPTETLKKLPPYQKALDILSEHVKHQEGKPK